MYKKKNRVAKIENSDNAPVCLELIVYAFGELGKPNNSDLITKVKYILQEDRSLHDIA